MAGFFVPLQPNFHGSQLSDHQSAEFAIVDASIHGRNDAG